MDKRIAPLSKLRKSLSDATPEEKAEWIATSRANRLPQPTVKKSQAGKTPFEVALSAITMISSDGTSTSMV